MQVIMQLPITYCDSILGWEVSPLPADGDGAGTQAYSFVYPPIGFFPFYGLGNGDCHGLYWPLRMEEESPLVAMTSHDVGSIIPENSDVERLYRCELSRSDSARTDLGGTLEAYRWLAEQATGRTQYEEADESFLPDDFAGLLTVDPNSPFLLAAVADVHLQANEPGQAIEFYSRAVSILPEYVAAHFGLALAYRRTRRAADAVRHLRESLLNPSAFYGGSFWAETYLPGNSMRNDWERKSLMWLQRSSERPTELADDPFLDAVKQLTLETGVKESGDIPILQSLIDTYLERDQPFEAVRLWMILGERAAGETTSFRERLGLTPRVFGTRLSELFRLAGLSRRAQLTDDMLTRHAKPNGLYL